AARNVSTSGVAARPVPDASDARVSGWEARAGVIEKRRKTGSAAANAGGTHAKWRHRDSECSARDSRVRCAAGLRAAIDCTNPGSERSEARTLSASGAGTDPRGSGVVLLESTERGDARRRASRVSRGRWAPAGTTKLIRQPGRRFDRSGAHPA